MPMPSATAAHVLRDSRCMRFGVLPPTSRPRSSPTACAGF